MHRARRLCRSGNGSDDQAARMSDSRPTRSPLSPAVRWAFLLFVFSIPFETPYRPIPVDIPTLTGVLFLLMAATQPRTCLRRMPWAIVCFGLFICVQALSSTLSGTLYLPEKTTLFLRLLELVLVAWAGLNAIRAGDMLRPVLVTFAGATFLRALAQVVSGAVGSTATARAVRLSLLGQDANTSAGILVAGAMICIGLTLVPIARGSRGSRHRARRIRFMLWGAAAVILVAIVQTGSRGAVIALAAGLITFVVAGQDNRVRYRAVVTGAIALVALGVLVVRSPLMSRRLIEALDAGNLAGREQIYPALLGMLSEKPLMGWGPVANQYELAARIYEPDRQRRIARREGTVYRSGSVPRWNARGTHNLYLEVLTSTGLLGAAAFFAGLLLCARGVWRARGSTFGVLPLALLSTILVFNMSENRLVGNVEWLVIALALVSALPAISRAPPAPARWASRRPATAAPRRVSLP